MHVCTPRQSAALISTQLSIKLACLEGAVQD